jgi:hypothetical protein
MAFLGLVLLVALLIPIIGLVLDSPVGRALARRLEGPEQPAAIGDLARRVEVLETELEEMQRGLKAVEEENQFLQRLLEEQPGRTLPPPKTP